LAELSIILFSVSVITPVGRKPIPRVAKKGEKLYESPTRRERQKQVGAVSQVALVKKNNTETSEKVLNWFIYNKTDKADHITSPLPKEVFLKKTIEAIEMEGYTSS